MIRSVEFLIPFPLLPWKPTKHLLDSVIKFYLSQFYASSIFTSDNNWLSRNRDVEKVALYVFIWRKKTGLRVLHAFESLNASDSKTCQLCFFSTRSFDYAIAHGTMYVYIVGTR